MADVTVQRRENADVPRRDVELTPGVFAVASPGITKLDEITRGIKYRAGVKTGD